MKIKVLINCHHSRLVEDLLANRSASFDCLTTSGYSLDILRHVEVYQPDIFLTFFDKYDFEVIQQYYALKRERQMFRLPFAVIGRDDVCDTCAKYDTDLFTTILRRPITVFKIREKLKHAVEQAQHLPMHAEASRGGELPEQWEEDFSEPMPLVEKKKILVVDDDKNVLRMLKTALERRYDVTTMTSGRMAQKYLETKDADLILLDYQMPHENGAEVLKKIRANPAHQKIPVIFLTGVAETSKVQEVISLDLQGYLLKPVNMERLFQMIKELIG